MISQARQRLGRVAGSIAPGATLRRARLVAALLEDARIVDAGVVVTADGVVIDGDSYVVPSTVSVQLDAARDVTFRPAEFEAAGPGRPTTAPVDVRLRVTVLDVAVAPASVEARATALLTTVIANAPALTTDLVGGALGGETSFVALAEHTVLAVEIGPGQFVEARPGDAPLVAPAGRTFELRTVVATPDGTGP